MRCQQCMVLFGGTERGMVDGMKRLVAFGLVMAVATGAYAQFGTMVYDFKATVKNTNIKTIQVKAPITATLEAKTAAPSLVVEVKYVQDTVLYGYVIDGGYGWTWAVIANQGQKTKIGRLFAVSPMMVKLFNPKFKVGDSIEDPMKTTFGAEGGLMMWTDEDWYGDNVLWDGNEFIAVQQWYDGVGGLFGRYDDDAETWLYGTGFGTASLEIPYGSLKEGKLEVPRFTLNLAGSIVGAWYYCEECTGYYDEWFPIDMWVCGYPPHGYYEEANSWITGTWTLKSNFKLQPAFAGEYGPCYTAAALMAINPNQQLEDAEDYTDYP